MLQPRLHALQLATKGMLQLINLKSVALSQVFQLFLKCPLVLTQPGLLHSPLTCRMLHLALLAAESLPQVAQLGLV